MLPAPMDATGSARSSPNPREEGVGLEMGAGHSETSIHAAPVVSLASVFSSMSLLVQIRALFCGEGI